jgi:hypothetical protein
MRHQFKSQYTDCFVPCKFFCFHRMILALSYGSRSVAGPFKKFLCNIKDVMLH